MVLLILMVIVGLIILGLCFGSFVNALVWRLWQQSKVKNHKSYSIDYTGKSTNKDLSIVHGRSMCTQCQHQLEWYDLLPVVSWLILGGKCRYCKTTIGMQYPLVELLTAGLFIYSYWYWPYAFNSQGITLFIFWLVFLVGFVALAVYDLRWMLLPDRIVFPLQALALVYAVAAAALLHTGWQGLISAALGVLCLAGVFYGLFQVSKGKWIGGGDVKLAVILGLLVGGPLKALLVIFIASLLGCVFSIPLLLKGKAKMRIPFGPFLILATILVFLFGASLIAWYKSHFLFL